MTIGQRICYLRKKNNLTQSELAKKLYVSPKTVSKWENGYGLPDIKIIPEIAKVFSVDCDYILTGKYRKIESSVVQKVDKEIEPVYDKKAFKLSLHQVTHNNFSIWLALLNILILLITLVFGPIDLKYNNQNKFGTLTILSAFYEPLGDFIEFNGWTTAISIVWFIEILFIVISSIIMIVSVLNGTSEYFIKITLLQFIAIIFLAILSCIGCWYTNLYNGEIIMRVNSVYIALIFSSFFLWFLNYLVSKHGKIIKYFRYVSAIILAVLIALSVVVSVVPKNAVAKRLDENVISFSPLDLSVNESEFKSESGTWWEYDGEGILKVTTNLKITYLYDVYIEFDKGNYKQTMFANGIYLKTEFIDKELYYNYFKIEIVASSDYERITEFDVYVRLIKDGKLFTIETTTEIEK